MKLIVGLGNPGIRYVHTKHNVGFWVVDQLSERWGIPLSKEKWNAVFGEGRVDGEKVILLKPLTYMNLSGESVRPLLDFYKLTLDDLVVIYDDLDLPIGHLRLRMKGSAGGHNGMKSLIYHLKSEQFKRMKVGIGRPIHRIPIVDYVLSSFAEEELPHVLEATEKAVKATESWIQEGFILAMNRFNTGRE